MVLPLLDNYACKTVLLGEMRGVALHLLKAQGEEDMLVV